MVETIGRKIMTVFLNIFFFLVPFFCMANYEEVFLQANACYVQKEYQKALELYQKIEPKSDNVLYNMGNCSYRLHDYGAALIFWRKAEHKGYARALIEHNCQKAYQALQLEQTEKNRWFEHGKNTIHYYSMKTWQFLFLVSWYILLLGLCWLPILRKKILLLSLLLIQGFITSGLGLKIVTSSQQIGIIKQNEVLLFAGTDEQFSKRGKLVKGQEVIIHEKRDAWCKVSQDNHNGWLKADTLEYVSC